MENGRPTNTRVDRVTGQKVKTKVVFVGCCKNDLVVYQSSLASLCVEWIDLPPHRDVRSRVKLKDADVLVVDTRTLPIDTTQVGSDVISFARAAGFDGKALLLATDRPIPYCSMAAEIGAFDFLVGNSRQRVSEEIAAICASDGGLARAGEETRRKSGFLRTAGLTPREIQIMEDWERLGFPPVKILANHLCRPCAQIRKTFHNIYGKLRSENRTMAELAHVLTALRGFRVDRRTEQPKSERQSRLSKTKRVSEN